MEWNSGFGTAWISTILKKKSGEKLMLSRSRLTNLIKQSRYITKVSKALMMNG